MEPTSANKIAATEGSTDGMGSLGATGVETRAWNGKFFCTVGFVLASPVAFDPGAEGVLQMVTC